AQHTIAAVRGLWNQDHYARRQEDVENKQIIAEAIQGGVKNEQELRLNPRVAAAIDALPPTDRNKVPGQINTYNAGRDKSANTDEYQRIMGMSNNDVRSFLELDPYQQKLNSAQMDKIAARQRALKKDQNQDPRVDRALVWMRISHASELEALGIYRRN